MQKLFNNILLPVTIDRNIELHIEKAISLANHLRCNLHLLGISSPPSLFSLDHPIFRLESTAKINAEKKQRLCDLQSKYCQQLNKGQILSIYFETGEPETIIASYAAMHQVDLVFTAENRKKFLFLGGSPDASRLAENIHCPVLSLQSHRALQGMKIIVMPVGRSLPISKIRVAVYLAKHFNASIHLVTREKRGLMYEELAYMQKALQVLKDNTDVPVKCKTLSGDSLGNIALQYAKEVDAGLILLNPGAESFLPGFGNRLFSRFVYNESRIPVMTVS